MDELHGGRGAGAARRARVGVEAVEHLLRQRRVERPARERVECHDADEGALQGAHVALDPLGDDLERLLIGEFHAVVIDSLAQHGHARVEIGWVDVGDEPRLEAIAQAVLECGEVARQAVRGQDELAARVMQRVERVEELLLGARLGLQELHVVDQQDVDAAKVLLEAVDVAAAVEGAQEAVGERLGRRVADGESTAVRAHVVADRVQQVGLADTGRAVEEERVVGDGRLLGHGQRRGVGEPVAVAEDELLEGELRVELVAYRAGWSRDGLGPVCGTAAIAGDLHARLRTENGRRRGIQDAGEAVGHPTANWPRRFDEQHVALEPERSQLREPELERRVGDRAA